MNRLALVLVASAFILSCSHAPEKRTVFIPPDNDYSILTRDEADCNFRVNQAMAGYRWDSSTIWGAAMGRAQANSYTDTMFRQCMVAKGYTVREEYVEKGPWKSSMGFTGFLVQSDGPKPVIISVHPVSPADKQGMKVGDTITEVNGQKITDTKSYLSCSSFNAGEWVEYKVLRETKELISDN